MVKFTFLELHFDDSTLTANAPYSHGEKDVVAGDEPPEEPEESSGVAAVFAVLVGLVFLAVVAYVVKRRVLDAGDGELDEDTDTDPIELDDIDV